jgi:hypothetical protein
VSVQERLRTMLCCAVLELGALAGIPMRPEQIRDLMQSLNQPTVAQTNPDRASDGGAPDEPA